VEQYFIFSIYLQTLALAEFQLNFEKSGNMKNQLQNKKETRFENGRIYKESEI